MLKKYIPNLFTMLNLLCGCIAALLAVQGHLVFAAVFVGGGIFFDFFDGFFARLLRVSGNIGKELDSLADMITSGLVPGIVMMQLLTLAMGENTTPIMRDFSFAPVFHFGFPAPAFIGLLITLASGYRLAKFNVDMRQTSSFMGLPTPANAIFILSLPLILTYQGTPRIDTVLLNRWFLLGVTLLSSVLLNVELPLFGLKFKTFGLRENWFRYLFLLFALLAILSLHFLALPIIISVYVLFSAGLDLFQ